MGSKKKPLLCRLGLHALPNVFVQSIWGGIWTYERHCKRECGFAERLGEVEYERRYLGR